ncbi:phage tail protein [Escherichia coli]|nr:phage tail protein [Escherichia coli]
MENYYYSQKENIFYPTSIRMLYEQANSWPSDYTPVSDAIFEVFSDIPKGKQRIVGKDGMPAFIDIPLT